MQRGPTLKSNVYFHLEFCNLYCSLCLIKKNQKNQEQEIYNAFVQEPYSTPLQSKLSI